MTPYFDLSITARGLFGIWFSVLLLMGCDVALRLAHQKNFRFALLQTPPIAMSYIILQRCVHVNMMHKNGIEPSGPFEMFCERPWLWLLFAGIMLTVLSLLAFIQARTWNQSHVTVNSLKEGMDNMPSGLCWYYEDGTVALKNKTISGMCFQLTGDYLYNGNVLEKAIKDRQDSNGMLHMDDGTVWSCHTRSVQKGKIPVREITAFNVTDEYEKTKLLNEKRLEAIEANRQLTRYGQELAQMIAASEILAAKVRIHDELGQALLLTRKYLLRDEGPEEKARLLEILRQNNSLLEHSENEQPKDYHTMLLEAADDMGIKLVIRGEIPEEGQLSSILNTAIHENLTNTIRHARGDEITVEIHSDAKSYTAEFTNNGVVPEEPIEEKGGLAMLRVLVESAGGRMTIESSPAYKMVISFDAAADAEMQAGRQEEPHV